MRRVLFAAALLAFVPTIASAQVGMIAGIEYCELARIAKNNAVKVDWSCVKRMAADFTSGRNPFDIGPRMALVMKAIRAGKAK